MIYINLYLSINLSQADLIRRKFSHKKEATSPNYFSLVDVYPCLIKSYSVCELEFYKCVYLH